MRTSVASEQLNFFIIVICELWPLYSFLLQFSDCSFGNGLIDHLMDLLNDFTLYKLQIFIKLTKSLKRYVHYGANLAPSGAKN